MIMSAFLNFRRGKYQDAINDAQRYVTLFPASQDAAYAQYLIGESYFRQIPDVTRDQDLAKKAIDAMGEVIAKYPDSEYANDAHNKIQVARDQIAGKEMQIGRYYLERHEFLAAVNRFRTVVEQYQTTRHVEEALHRLTETYLALGIVPEAQTAAAVLGHNFPDSEWYQDSYRLLNKGGLAAAGEQGLLDFPGLRPGVALEAPHAGEPHRPGHRPDRPARHRVRRGADGADRRDRRRQIHPARCACAGAWRARRRGAGARRRGARPGHGGLRAAGRSPGFKLARRQRHRGGRR